MAVAEHAADDGPQRAGTDRCVSDGLASHYSGLASDANEEEKLRQAAMLFSLAERFLDDSEDHVECERTAREAFLLFREIGNATGQADALRLIIHSHRLKAEEGKYRTGNEQLSEKTVMDAAEKIAADELKFFNASENKYGECAMLLSLAEVNFYNRGIQSREEAAEAAMSAQKLAIEIGNRKFEGIATFVLSAIRSQEEQKAEAAALADECIQIFRELGARKLEGKSWHMLALSRVQKEELEDGIHAAVQAMNIFRELGITKLEAYENFCIANYHLLRAKGQEALPFAQDALLLLKKINYGMGWQSDAYNLIVDCYLCTGNITDALSTAQEHREFLKERSDTRSEVVALHKLSQIHMQAFKLREALRAAEEALDVAQGLKDQCWEAFMMRQVAEIYLAKKDYDEAEKFAEQAVDMATQFADKQEEAMIRGTLTQIAIARRDLQNISLAVNEQRALFQQTGDKPNEARMLLQSASVLANEGKTEEAFEVIAEASEIFKEIKDPRGEAEACKAEAHIYQMKGKHESALEAAGGMREKLKATGDLAQEGAACALLAQIHLQRDNPAEAVRLASAGQQLCKKAGNKRAEADLWILVSQALLEKFAQDGHEVILKNRTKALKPAQEALSMAKKVNDRALEASALYQVASVHTATGKIGDAMQAANQARSIFHGRGDVQSEAATVLLIAETQYVAGRHEKATAQARAAMVLAKECGDSQLAERAEQLIGSIDRANRQEQPVQVEHLPSPAAVPVVEAPTETFAAASLVSEMASVDTTPKGMDKSMVAHTVNDAIGQIIGSENSFSEDDPLVDIGLDSLSALSFRQTLSKALGLRLPASFVFDYPSSRSITDRIVEISLQDSPASASQRGPPASAKLTSERAME